MKSFQIKASDRGRIIILNSFERSFDYFYGCSNDLFAYFLHNRITKDNLFYLDKKINNFLEKP